MTDNTSNDRQSRGPRAAPSQGGRGGTTAVPRRRQRGRRGRRGIRQVELDPPRVNLPIEPTREEKGLRHEQEVARVEILMLKGIRSRHQLGALLGYDDLRRVDSMIRKVHARWEITAGGMDVRRHRGEALHKLDLLESELWSILSNTEDVKEKIVAAKTIIEAQDRRNPLLGLTKEALKSHDGSQERDSFAVELGRHQQMKEMAERMSALLKGQVLEHEERQAEEGAAEQGADDGSEPAES